MATKDIKKIINDRGGYRVVAEALTREGGHRVPETTVHAWYRKNKIPAWRAALVLNLPKISKRSAA